MSSKFLPDYCGPGGCLRPAKYMNSATLRHPQQTDLTSTNDSNLLKLKELILQQQRLILSAQAP